jgi:hypothetical protein
MQAEAKKAESELKEQRKQVLLVLSQRDEPHGPDWSVRLCVSSLAQIREAHARAEAERYAEQARLRKQQCAPSFNLHAWLSLSRP